jgi:hypothetical protein
MNLFDEKNCAAIVARINRLTPDSKAAWGKMNVCEMLCHCADGIKMATGERAVADKSSFLFRTLVKPLVIHVFPMPKSAPTADEINPAKSGTRPSEFDADRQALLDAVEGLCALPVDFAFSNHALFGKLTRKEWGLIGHKHLDHHLKQFGV